MLQVMYLDGVVSLRAPVESEGWVLDSCRVCTLTAVSCFLQLFWHDV